MDNSRQWRHGPRDFGQRGLDVLALRDVAGNQNDLHTLGLKTVHHFARMSIGFMTVHHRQMARTTLDKPLRHEKTQTTQAAGDQITLASIDLQAGLGSRCRHDGSQTARKTLPGTPRYLVFSADKLQFIPQARR